MALGRKETAEPLSSGRPVAAHGGRGAGRNLALENGRLYHQSRSRPTKSTGCASSARTSWRRSRTACLWWGSTTASSGGDPPARRVVRDATGDAVGRRHRPASRSGLLRDPASRPARVTRRSGALPRAARDPATAESRSLLLNVAAAPLRNMADGSRDDHDRRGRLDGRVKLEEQLQISEKMASIGLLCRGGARGQHAPHGDFQLRADAAARGGSVRSRARRCSQDRSARRFRRRRS